MGRAGVALLLAEVVDDHDIGYELVGEGDKRPFALGWIGAKMVGMDELAATDLGTALPDVLRRVEGGHSFRITLDGRPVAWLLPPHGRPQTAPMEWVVEQLNRACVDHELVIDLRETLDHPCDVGWP